MSAYSGPNGMVWKIATLLVPFLVAAIITVVTLKADVRHLEEEMSYKADASVVEANQAAILRELNAIQSRLDRLVPR